MMAAFKTGLGELGYQEGTNVAIEYRWAMDHIDQLPLLAADLVRRGVAVIAATGGDAPTRYAKAATTTIPIVFATGGDPLRAGFVTSLNRPTGNVTGITFFTLALGFKRLELLRELVSRPGLVALLVNPVEPDSGIFVADVMEAASSLGQGMIVVKAESENDFDHAFATMRQQQVQGLFVLSHPLFTSRREHLIELAAHYAIPAIYSLREFCVSGGLMSYGASITDAYRQTGVYVGRILRGAKPEELPVLQPSKFELTLNLKTAKELDLKVPPSLLARADEVIE
jgi:putative ABC transport system substrate-binding protein